MTKYVTILALLALGGCATFSPENAALQQQLQADNDRRVDQFNVTTQHPLPYPHIVLGTCSAEPGQRCYSERDGSTITVDPAICRADMDDCLNDTLPHEDSHWAIAYYNLEPTPLGVPRDSVHTVLWASLMRSFGGDPCKHYKEFC